METEDKNNNNSISKDRKATLESLSLEELERYGPNESRRMMKNVVVVSFGFLLLFTAFNSISNLQSSLHPQVITETTSIVLIYCVLIHSRIIFKPVHTLQGGLGTYGMSTTYAGIILSSLVVPTFAIQKLTAKWTVVIAMCGYIPYMGAQFHPTFATIIPTAALVGVSGAPLW